MNSTNYIYNGIPIELKTQTCTNHNNISHKLLPGQVNLYIRITDECNARCKYCVYTKEHSKQFDMHYFKKVLKDIKRRGILGKIQITGGEPTYNKQLIDICKLLRSYFTKEFIGINSNGYNLETLKIVAPYLDNIAISRHHYNDEVNTNIFGSLTPSSQQLMDFIQDIGAEKIHFSCNLIKGYIDSVEEIKAYAEYASKLDCIDLGFVTLMPVNEYCKQNQIIFNNLKIEEDPEIINYRQFNKGEFCKCSNYLYFCKTTGKMSGIYARFVCNKSKSANQIVYDVDKLRYGFGGPEIPIN